MPHYNTPHLQTQLELFEPEQMYFITWTSKDGKHKQTKYPVNILCALTYVRVLQYDRTTTNHLIKKAPTTKAGANSKHQ